jgi:hypothetical protein
MPADLFLNYSQLICAQKIILRIQHEYKVLAFMSLVGISIVFSDCQKDVQPTCGCASATVNTITNEKGLLFFSVPDNQYYLAILPIQAGSTSLIICDPNVSQLDNLLSPDKNTVQDTVIFGGQGKKICDNEIPPGPGIGGPYQKIVLSSISKF